MSPAARYAQKYAKARQRRYRKAHERLARDRRQAQHAAEALQQALDDLGLPEDLVTEIEGRLRSQHKLLGKIVGMMCPPLFGCRTNTELCRVRGWDKNLPSHPPARGAAQTVLAQATPTLGPGGPDPAVAPCRPYERGHAQPLAVDLGGRWLGVQKVWGAVGSGGHLVEWPGTPGALRD